MDVVGSDPCSVVVVVGTVAKFDPYPYNGTGADSDTTVAGMAQCANESNLQIFMVEVMFVFKFPPYPTHGLGTVAGKTAECEFTGLKLFGNIG